MSTGDESDGVAEHQSAYIYSPNGSISNVPTRPSQRRKAIKPKTARSHTKRNEQSTFETLLNGNEEVTAVELRHEIFQRFWAVTEKRIQSVLEDANERTLAEVTAFVIDTEKETIEGLPTGFIVTGPNIASQDLLFQQLSVRLRKETNDPVVVVRSGDAPNLKATLKQIIRDATSQIPEGTPVEQYAAQDVRKLLSYDLEKLYNFAKSTGSRRIVVIFKDSEALDTVLITELISLFQSWTDRIPFLVLFGVATSVELLYERLPREATRCLVGTHFNVTQTSRVLERIFLKAVAGTQAPLRLGEALLSTLVARQEDHTQSVQNFSAALKYFECVRMLPSFKSTIERRIQNRMFASSRDLLTDDDVLLKHMLSSLVSGQKHVIHLLRIIHVLASSSSEPVGKVDIYITAFHGNLSDSELVHRTLESVRRMAPSDICAYIKTLQQAVELGCPEMDLDGWADEAVNLLCCLSGIGVRVAALIKESEENGIPVRSVYAIRSKGMRTTVVAQRVQLSYEDSTLSSHDKLFTTLVEELLDLLSTYIKSSKSPKTLFLHEVWLHDESSSHDDVFTPHIRSTIELALASPHHYSNTKSIQNAFSVEQLVTARIYQLCSEAGSLINVSDLWRAFLDTQQHQDDEDHDERAALALFYKGLAELKFLGVVKPSKRKLDHIAKVTWQDL